MKQITINLYSFNELSETAKETAIEYFRDSNTSDFEVSDANSTLNKFCDIFNITWRRFDYEEMYRSEYSFNIESEVLELRGVRLATYIWNNFKSDLFKGKWFNLGWDSKNRVLNCNKGNLSRYSKIMLEHSCVLTGMCYDGDCLQPIYEFLEKPKDIDFETLLNDCLHSLAHSVSSAIEYQNSDEAIIETIEANEYTFEQDGTMNNG